MIRNLTILAILTAVTVLAWIGFTIYYNLRTSTLTEEAIIRVAPITPTFDRKAIQEISKRKQIQVDLADRARRTSSTQSATISTAPIVTPTPLVTQDSESTPSQQLQTQ